MKTPNDKVSRREAIRLVTAGMLISGVGCSTASSPRNTTFLGSTATPNSAAAIDKWANTHDRVWLGGEFWANPMEDWRIVGGKAECISPSGNRSVHSLTHRLTDTSQPFHISITINKTTTSTTDGGSGIRLGINTEIDEYRSSCFVQQGLDIGIIGNQLAIGNRKVSINHNIIKAIEKSGITLNLTGKPQLNAVVLHVIASISSTGEVIGSLEHLTQAKDVIGNVAIVSNFSFSSNASSEDIGSCYQFSNWTIQGGAFSVEPERKFGPILWAMHTLSDSQKEDGWVMKLSAFSGPMGEKSNQFVELEIQRNNRWISIDKKKLDPDVWVATFRIAHWNEHLDTPYRVIYRENHIDDSITADIWQGTIRANPRNRPLRMAALTCQNDYSFPYAPVVDNVEKLDPDIIFFSGDQIYESHGGFGIIRAPFKSAINNYLRKFYQFGWAFGETMRNRPTLCLPDDHDVFQGNLWGEGGQPNKNPKQDPTASYFGGYIEPVRFVNAVHRTCVSHHPDAYDPTPNPSGISCYYGEMLYGGVSFAILADRQWKSGPEQAGVIVGETGVDEDPQFLNPAINPKNPQLLGERQEMFLEQWARDWRGHTLKAVLSQTVFAGISTHQPTPERYLKYDFDSSGWPGQARDRAIDIMRESMALHICGDTHLPSLAQYGVKTQRDSNWSFCTPAISVGWPRWWLPDEVGIEHTNRPSHQLPNTGEFIDSFGNKNYVYAVGMPDIGQSKNRYIKAHEKGSGFGFVVFDSDKRTYTLHAYRYLVDVFDTNTGHEFSGWPVTIHQEENMGINHIV